MDKYTASNGVEVYVHDAPQGRRVSALDNDPADTPGHARPDSIHSYLDPRQADALREFFQAERDEELGRWRCPEIRDQVVYPSGGGCISLSETTGISKVYETRAEAAGDRSYLAPAARAYFEAHPEPPKPWHDAKPGEVWVLTLDGGEEVPCAAIESDSDFVPISHRRYAKFANGSERIIAARRIYPEDAS